MEKCSKKNPLGAVKLGASIVHGPHVFNFTDVYEALDRAGGARRVDTQEALVKQLGQLLSDPAARESSVAAWGRVVGELGGALDRTLAALEPYLLQLRLEMGAANAGAGLLAPAVVVDIAVTDAARRALWLGRRPAHATQRSRRRRSGAVRRQLSCR